MVSEAPTIARIGGPYSPIQRAGLQAARLIELAMDACGKDDLKSLECLLEARRALSPMVDGRPAAPPENSADKPKTETSKKDAATS